MKKLTSDIKTISYSGRSSDLLILCAPSHLALGETVDVELFAQGFWLSLQQRVCSGFSPDSLFTTRLEAILKRVTPKLCYKDKYKN